VRVVPVFALEAPEPVVRHVSGILRALGVDFLAEEDFILKGVGEGRGEGRELGVCCAADGDCVGEWVVRGLSFGGE